MASSAISRTDKQTVVQSQPVYYSDFLTNFTKHPATGSLSRVTNSNSIRQAITMIVLTNYGERPYQPLVGGNVRGSLFELMDDFAISEIQSSIASTIFNNDPRIPNLAVKVTPNPDNNSYTAKITFQSAITKTTDSVTISLVRNR